MKKLSKSDRKRLDDILDRLRERMGDFQNARTEFEAALALYNGEIASFNEVLEEARGFSEDMSMEIETYMDERSEAWHDSDRASEFESWKDRFDELAQVEDVEELDIGDEPELENIIDIFDDVPEAPEDA